VTVDPEQRQAMKQMVKARERAAARARFPLPDDVLAAFFAGLEKRIGESGCDDTRRFAEEWLGARGHNTEGVIAWLAAAGGYCDCEVVANAKPHWQENRLGAHRGDEPT
jgi:hypothetical protein